MPRNTQTSSVSEARGRKTCITVKSAVRTLVAPVSGRRINLYVSNASQNAVYLGDVNVAINTGIQLAGGAAFEDSHSYDEWYMIPASGTSDLRVVITELDA